MGLNEDCNTLENLPRLTFTLGDQNFSLPPDSYYTEVHGLVSNDVIDHFQIDHFNNTKNKSCQPAIMKLALKSSIGDTWVLGAPFFRSYYTTFVQGEVPSVYTAEAGRNCDLAGDDVDEEADEKTDERNLHGSRTRQGQHVVRGIDASL